MLHRVCVDQGVFILHDAKFSPDGGAEPMPQLKDMEKLQYNWPSALGNGDKFK